MAPQKGGQATKQQKQQQFAGTGTVKKPVAASAAAARPAVVPAIPLPMMQRQASTKDKGTSTRSKQHTAPPAVASSGASPVASLEAALIDQQAAPAAADAKAMARPKQRRNKQQSGVHANGTRVEKPGLTTTTTTTATMAATNGEHHGSDKHYPHRQHLAANGAPDSVMIQGVPPAHGVNGLGNGVANLTFGDNVRSPTALSLSASPHASTAQSVAGDAESAPGSAALNGVLNEARSEFSTMPVVQSTQSTDFSLSRHPRLKPHGDDPTQGLAPNFDGYHAPLPQHHHGSGIMFGGVPTPDSHTPSPASGAFMPPPPRPFLNGLNGDGHKIELANGRRAYQGHLDSNGNGFVVPSTPFRPGPEHVNSMDSYGPVPAAVSAHRTPIDGYPPNAPHYEPPTPHSFHGSHASGEFNGLENIVPFHPSRPGFDHDHRNGHSRAAPPMQPFMAPQQFTGRPAMEEELLDSVMFFQNQFNSAELADCILELKYPDSYNHPVKLNGHKLIFARSPALKQHIMVARAADPGCHVFTINATDRYLRSDAWFTAIQRLYLYPLFSPPPPGNGAEFAGNNLDQFRFCLGYAAAGHLLEMRDVLLRGIEIAARMVNWYNIEEALAFALDESSKHQTVVEDGQEWTNIDFAYGPHIRIMMASITNFVINYFPPNFNLDTTIADPLHYARVPPVPSAQTSPSNSAPAIARGTSARRPPKGNRLSVIKFGDLPTAYPDDEIGVAPREQAKCTPQLSRILLNLPFHDLSYVLGEVRTNDGYNTAQDRFHALADVVAEREARRLRTVEAVRTLAVPGAKEIQQRLAAPTRYDIVDQWDILNWQEEVIQPTGSGVPKLVRTWVPQFHIAEAAPETTKYEANPLASMV